MEKKITQAEVEHVARLARLGLAGEDREMFSRQLNEILLYMEKLGELDTDGVEPLAHVLPLENVLREDKARPGIGQDKALANTPEKKDGLFKVPPVIE